MIESHWYTAHLLEMEPASEACLKPVSPRAKKRGNGSIQSSVSKQREPLNASNSFSSRDVQIINVPKVKGQAADLRGASASPQLISCLEGMNLNKMTLRQYQDLYADIQLEHFNHHAEPFGRNHKSCQRKLRVVSTSYPLSIQSHHSCPSPLPMDNYFSHDAVRNNMLNDHVSQVQTKCATSQYKQSGLNSRRRLQHEGQSYNPPGVQKFDPSLNLEHLFNSDFSSIEVTENYKGGSSKMSLHSKPQEGPPGMQRYSVQ